MYADLAARWKTARMPNIRMRVCAGSMLDQVNCLNDCDNGSGGCVASGTPQAEVRAALAVKFGNGLRAKYDSDNIMFLNRTASSNCTTAYNDCPNDLPEFSVMVLPIAP